MKLVSYILSFYLILLAAIPCCAFDSCPDDKQEQTVNHESGDEDCGSCSPFFNCEGCMNATQITEPFVLSPVMELTSGLTYAGLIQSFKSYDFHTIWQPPQLV